MNVCLNFRPRAVVSGAIICHTFPLVDLRQVSMEMPMYLMQEDEGNDEEIMRLLGLSNSSPSSSNLSESSSDSGNASEKQLGDSVAGDQMGGDYGYLGAGIGMELAGGCGSDSGGGIMEVLDGQLCSPEILEQLMFMDIDCSEAHDDVAPCSLEELVSQVATGTIDQSMSTAISATVTADPISNHLHQNEGGCDGIIPEKTVVQLGEDLPVAVSSRAKLSLPVRHPSPASELGSTEVLLSTPSELSTSPTITPSGSSTLASTDRENLPNKSALAPALPTYSVAVPRVDLTNSGPERAVLTLQATPILSVEHTTSVSQARRHKNSAAVSF